MLSFKIYFWSNALIKYDWEVLEYFLNGVCLKITISVLYLGNDVHEQKKPFGLMVLFKAQSHYAPDLYPAKETFETFVKQRVNKYECFKPGLNKFNVQ